MREKWKKKRSRRLRRKRRKMRARSSMCLEYQLNLSISDFHFICDLQNKWPWCIVEDGCSSCNQQCLNNIHFMILVFLHLPYVNKMQEQRLDLWVSRSFHRLCQYSIWDHWWVDWDSHRSDLDYVIPHKVSSYYGVTCTNASAVQPALDIIICWMCLE